MKMTKTLEECLIKLRNKYHEGEEFKADDISPTMFSRSRYNLDRLVELGLLKRRVHLYERTMNVVSYYSL
jgi:hypothetical protein